VSAIGIPVRGAVEQDIITGVPDEEAVVDIIGGGVVDQGIVMAFIEEETVLIIIAGDIFNPGIIGVSEEDAKAAVGEV